MYIVIEGRSTTRKEKYILKNEISGSKHFHLIL